MTISKQIVDRVAALGTDRVFSIADLELPASMWENARVKLNRMEKAGEIVKIAPGKYYAPRISILGMVPPSTKELVKDLLYRNGQLDGYLTGLSIWDSMGVTTQFSATIFIGLNRRKDPIMRSGREIRFILQPNEITENNTPFLQILDAIKFIKTIPDTTIQKSIARLKEILATLGDSNLKELIDLALKYPPRTRALTGAIIDAIGHTELTHVLTASLNPLTAYDLNIDTHILPTINDWNIK